ncbi:BglG family transcription antiterminator [Tannockella kyphosi]|uniref:BglG family transcription antiterminator n=1 Tax=Tannockella kyphosi TaxID=2899121 RepID=UPI0020135DD2|nr:PTS sugar transporter subunit IIA [Tannockella kyphosi]
MKKRLLSILTILCNSNQFVSSDMLAKELSVSTRTIRSDISEINSDFRKIGICIESNTKKGYFIEKKDEVIAYIGKLGVDQYMPIDPFERRVYLLTFFACVNQFSTINEICKTLYCAQTTIQNDVRYIKDLLLEYKKNSKHEEDKDYIYLFNEIVKSYLSTEESIVLLSSITGYITNDVSVSKKVEDTYKDIYQLFAKNNLTISNKNLITITVLCVLMVIRDKFNPGTSSNSVDRYHPLTKSVYEIIVKNFSASFSNDDLRYIDKIISNSIKSDDKINSNLFEDDVKEFISLIKDTYGLDFSLNSSFIEQINYHIVYLMQRLNDDVDEFNPLTEEIKSKFYLASEMSILLKKIIHQNHGLNMNDSEISYITLHVAAALEIINIKTKILIVSDLENSNLRYLKIKLNNYFVGKIEIINCVSKIYYENEEIEDKYDIILSTDLLKKKGDDIIVKINPFVQQSDLNKIKRYVNFYSVNIVDLESYFDYFDERLFFTGEKEMNYYEALYFLTQKMYEYGYFSDVEKYYQAIIEREEAYSTIMSNGVAIPHTMLLDSNSTMSAVMVLKKPIYHLNRKIEVIVLNGIKSDENLNKLYLLIEKLGTSKKTKLLAKSNSLSEFIFRI